MKPNGLWVSVEGEDDWRWWCIAEGFRLADLTHVHDVTLAPDASVMVLRSADDIDGFGDRFAMEVPGVRGYRMWVNWAAVAKLCQGIIIAPYIWERRLHPSASWYYSFDCASGCIWDAEAIGSVTLREVVAAPEPRD